MKLKNGNIQLQHPSKYNNKKRKAYLKNYPDKGYAITKKELDKILTFRDRLKKIKEVLCLK